MEKRGVTVGEKTPTVIYMVLMPIFEIMGKEDVGQKKLVGKEKRPVDFISFSFPHWEAGQFPNLP